MADFDICSFFPIQKHIHIFRVFTENVIFKALFLQVFISTVKPVTRGHLKKCPYMTGVPSSQVHFNVKVYFGSQKMQFRHPNLDILVSPCHRFYCTVYLVYQYVLLFSVVFLYGDCPIR